MLTDNKTFNLRVYGLLINDKHEVLVSDESRFGKDFTKFPGGGLEWGEGIKDCLIREFQEELNLQISVNDLFYITDFFQDSAFNPNDQLISIYYFVSTDSPESISVQTKKIHSTDSENHRWISLNTISEVDFTYPIDKIVAEKLKLQFINFF